jgi:hypothetical protein
MDGTLRTKEGLLVEVTVEDTREVYGRTDYLVRPRAGAGFAWVSSERVHLYYERRTA